MNRLLTAKSQICRGKALIPMSSSQTRNISSSVSLMSKLDQFRDPVSREKRFAEPVGRSWTAKELRRKSFDDLQKLWIVLYKEKNMLTTEAELSRRSSEYFPQPDRRQKVKKSMGAIKQVLGERKRAGIRIRFGSEEES